MATADVAYDKLSFEKSGGDSNGLPFVSTENQDRDLGGSEAAVAD